MSDSSQWLALEIGNSRLHWAWFEGENLQVTWDTPHLPASVVQQLAQAKTAELFKEILLATQLDPKSQIQSGRLANGFASGRSGNGLPDISRANISRVNLKSLPPLYIASVVPDRTALWQVYPGVHIITLDRVPLGEVYPTLGVDRALAVWGAGETYGFPVLVVDAGTALTFTGADGDRNLVGGAILPGLGLQLQSLGQKTANLPLIETQEILSLPQRWALNTPAAIQSGVIYTLIASLRDFMTAWWEKFPDSQICFKGGDGKLLLAYLRSLAPELKTKIVYAPHLIFWGMRSCRK